MKKRWAITAHKNLHHKRFYDFQGQKYYARLKCDLYVDGGVARDEAGAWSWKSQ